MSFASLPGACILPDGLSDEERREFMHNHLVNEERKLNMEKNLNKGKTPERQRVEYDYKTKLSMEDNEIPLFMKGVFIHPAIETSQKDIFAEYFCKRYFEDEEYRIENEGKYLFFEDGIAKPITNSTNVDPTTFTHKLFVPIGKLKSSNQFYKRCYNLKIDTNVEESDGIFFSVDIKRSFYVDCYTNGDENLNGSLTNKKIIDTGADITPLPNETLWDYSKSDFLNLEIKNKFFLKASFQQVNTCNGPKLEQIIYLKTPMYISIDGLNFAKLHMFTVGINQNEFPLPLIGMDIISQYTMIFSIFDGSFQLRVSNQRNEI